MKKGVSAVVATVFMITMVVSLAVVIFSWSNSFFEKTSSSIPSSKNCDGLDFRVFVSGVSGGNYEFEILNRANVDIESFKFNVFYQGSSDVIELDRGVLSMGSISGVVGLGSSIDEVLVYAVLSEGEGGEKKEWMCEDFPLVLDI